jgi:hypothetical protein
MGCLSQEAEGGLITFRSPGRVGSGMAESIGVGSRLIAHPASRDRSKLSFLELNLRAQTDRPSLRGWALGQTLFYSDRTKAGRHLSGRYSEWEKRS